MSRYNLELISTEPVFTGAVSLFKYRVTNTAENTTGESAYKLVVEEQMHVLPTQKAFYFEPENNDNIVCVFLFLSDNIKQISVIITPQNEKSFSDKQTIIINSDDTFIPEIVMAKSTSSQSLLGTFSGTIPPSDQAYTKTYEFRSIMNSPIGPWVHIRSTESNILNNGFLTDGDNSEIMVTIDKMTQMGHVYFQISPAGTAQLNISSLHPQWADMSYTMSASGESSLGRLIFYDTTLIDPELPSATVLPNPVKLDFQSSVFNVTVPAINSIGNGASINILVNNISLSTDVVSNNTLPLTRQYSTNSLRAAPAPNGMNNITDYLVLVEGGNVRLSRSTGFIAISPEINMELFTVQDGQKSDGLEQDELTVKLTSTINGQTMNAMNRNVTFSVEDKNTVFSQSGTDILPVKVDFNGTKQIAITNNSRTNVTLDVKCTLDDNMLVSRTKQVTFVAPVSDIFVLTSHVDKNSSHSDGIDANQITYTLLKNASIDAGENLTISLDNAQSFFLVNGVITPSPYTAPTDTNGQLTVFIINNSKIAADTKVTCQVTANLSIQHDDSIHFILPSNFIITLTPDKNTVQSDGKDIHTVVAKLTDNNVPVNGELLDFSFSGGAARFEPSKNTTENLTTNASGEATVQVSDASGITENVILNCMKANDPKVLRSVSLDFVKPEILDNFRIQYTVVNSPAAISNGTDLIHVTGLLTNNGVIVPNRDVTFMTSPNNTGVIRQSGNNKLSARTDSNGQISFDVSSNTGTDIQYLVSGMFTGSASVLGTTTIGFKAHSTITDRYAISVKANPPVGVLADGASQSVVAAFVTKNGIPAPGVSVLFTVNGSAFFQRNQQQQETDLTDIDGVLPFRVRSRARRNETVQVNCYLRDDKTVSGSATVGFIAPPVITRVYRLVLTPFTSSARVQPYPYPHQDQGANTATVRLIDQFGRAAPAGIPIDCYVQKLPYAYFRLLSHDQTNFAEGTDRAIIRTNSNGGFQLRIGQWKNGQGSFYTQSSLYAVYNGQTLFVNFRWFL